MTEWSEVTLGDVVTLQRGFDLPTRERRAGNVPVISSSGITGTHIEHKVEGPGVITGRYGTIGKVFYVEQDFWPLNTTLFVKDFKGNDPRFASYLLQTINFDAANDKTSVPGINRNHLHALPVRIPPVQIQVRIADILGSIDDKIELTHSMNETLEQMAMALYKNWFIDFGPFQEGEFVDSELGMIPKGWDIVKLDDYCEKITDGSHWSPPEATDSHHQIATVKNMGNYRMNLEGCKRISSKDFERLISEGCKPEPGDVLFSKDGTIGRVHLVDDDLNVALLSSIAIFRSRNEYSPFFLWLYLRNKKTQKMILNGYVSGSALPRVVLKDFKRAPLILPPVEVIREFDNQVRPLITLIMDNVKESDTLGKLRALLLPRLLSGEIDLREIRSIS